MFKIDKVKEIKIPLKNFYNIKNILENITQSENLEIEEAVQNELKFINDKLHRMELYELKQKIKTARFKGNTKEAETLEKMYELKKQFFGIIDNIN